jgi:hypothetical protein
MIQLVRLATEEVAMATGQLEKPYGLALLI